VQTDMLGTWKNCWRYDNGEPMTFAIRGEAEEAVKDHIIDCINAVEGGDMEDSPDPSEFRIVAIITPTRTAKEYTVGPRWTISCGPTVKPDSK